MILFLDFDGVLHPDEVFLEYGKPIMRCPPELGVPPEYAQLFSFAPILEAALASYPEIQIVLSTSWVSKIGFRAAKSALPESLQLRVVGSTYVPQLCVSDWDRIPRYDQIRRHAHRNAIRDWIAIDDDANGWPEDQRHRLVWCENATMGLYSEDVQARLREVLNGTG